MTKQILNDKEIFEKASKHLRDDYRKAAKKAAKTDEELSRKILRTADEICEYIEQVSNLQLLENYIPYFYDETEYLWDYMSDGILMIDDPDRIEETLNLRTTELREDFKVLLSRGQAIPKDVSCISDENDFRKAYKQPDVAVFTPFPKRIIGADTFEKAHNLQARQMLSFGGKMNVLESELKTYVKKGYRVTIVCASEERLKNLQEFVERIGLDGKILFEKGSLTGGMEFPSEKICYICEADIFITHKTSKRKKFKNKGQKLQSFADMRE